MDRVHSLTGLLKVETADDIVAHQTVATQREMVIATRLRTATTIAINLDASIAWNERRIIRNRMLEYASVH
jgi:hypothetical protein